MEQYSGRREFSVSDKYLMNISTQQWENN